MNNSSGISFFFHDSDIESWSINVVLDHLAKMEINLTPEEFLDKYKAQLISLSSQYGNSRVTKINFNGKDINDLIKQIKKDLIYQCHHWLHYFRKR